MGESGREGTGEVDGRGNKGERETREGGRKRVGKVENPGECVC